jgi:peroxiredoxin
MHHLKTILFSIVATVATVTVGWIFWEQEVKYASPTVVPDNFIDVEMGSHIDLAKLSIPSGKITVLHFFNPDCPCSKFNMKDFESLTVKYKDRANFIVVLQSDEIDAVEEFNDKYDLDLAVISDKQGRISDICGIYATPQAVILDKDAIMYYKGNYNQSRFCTRKETRFVEIALDSLIGNKPLPLFVRNELTLPYGCSLPSDENTDKATFNFF